MPNMQKLSHVADFGQVIVCLVIDFFMRNLLCFTGKLFFNSDFILVIHALFVIRERPYKSAV